MLNVTGKKITVSQMIDAWEHIPHFFEVNVWNFEVEAGKAAQSIFQKSFDIKKFNSSDGTPWPQRSASNRKSHPLMVETGSLRNSIKWKRLRDGGVNIYTDPKGFNNTKSHTGFCYAAVHNGPDAFRTGRVKNMPRRQFIGHSSVLEEELYKLSATIFYGLPK